MRYTNLAVGQELYQRLLSSRWIAYQRIQEYQSYSNPPQARSVLKRAISLSDIDYIFSAAIAINNLSKKQIKEEKNGISVYIQRLQKTQISHEKIAQD